MNKTGIHLCHWSLVWRSAKIPSGSSHGSHGPPLLLQRGVLTQEQVERLRRHIQQEFEAERESQLEGRAI